MVFALNKLLGWNGAILRFFYRNVNIVFMNETLIYELENRIPVSF